MKVSEKRKMREREKMFDARKFMVRKMIRIRRKEGKKKYENR